jgi:hypothetical protein
VELAEGMLFVELAKAKGDWLWHSDRIDNKSELSLGCLCGFVVERVKGRTENIDDEAEPITLCVLLLWKIIVVEALLILAPYFSWTQGILDNLSCGGWYPCRGTCNTEV